jgi:hypothetical protein
MASLTLHHFAAKQRKSTIPTGAPDYPAPPTPIRRPIAAIPRVDSRSDPASGNIVPVKVALTVIGIEAAAALCIYGAWQLLHFLLR